MLSGSIGIASVAPDARSTIDEAREVEALGFSTLWLAAGLDNNLPTIGRVLRATSRIEVASGIISVDHVTAREFAAAYERIEREAPGRFVAGLGGAHGPRPLATLGAYLDALDDEEPGVPAARRVLAALGPRMLELARDRASGAYPTMVTPEYTAEARQRLGPDTRLVVSLNVVLEEDPVIVRQLVGEQLRFLATFPHHAASLRRQGFSDQEVAALADRLIDSVTVWGDLDKITRRIAEYRGAGADQVVMRLVVGENASASRWRERLASALVR